VSGPDLLHVLVQLRKSAQGVQKLLLPSSELVVISLFVSIQNVIFQQDDQIARGRLLHV